MQRLKLNLPPAAALLVNATLFNLSWLAILLTQSNWIAPLVVAMHLLLHFRIMGAGRDELRVIVCVTAIGMVLDQLLFLTGVFNRDGQPGLAPLWLACLWPVFATTLLHVFARLCDRPYAAALLGAIGGALSYLAGVRLTEIEFGSTVWGPLVIAVLWAILFPLLLKLSARMVQTGAGDDLQSWEPVTTRGHD